MLELISRSAHPGGHAGVRLGETRIQGATTTRERRRSNHTRGGPASTKQETRLQEAKQDSITREERNVPLMDGLHNPTQRLQHLHRRR